MRLPLLLLGTISAATSTTPQHIDPLTGARIVDMFEKNGPESDSFLNLADAPPSWQQDILLANKLWTPDDSTVASNNMPMIGNGFIATQLSSDSVWVSGVYNGFLTQDPSHRARIPATNCVPAPGISGPAALDVLQATYFRRSVINPSSPPGTCTLQSTTSCTTSSQPIWVEQRWYAHRAIGSTLVMEVQILSGGDTTTTVSLINNTDSLFAMLRLVNNPGAPSTDFNFTTVPVHSDAPYSLVLGVTRIPETVNGSSQNIAMMTTNLPDPVSENGMLVVNTSIAYQTFTYLTVVRTSIETDVEQLSAAVYADYSTAVGLSAAGSLHSSHVAEWAATVWGSGLEIANRPDVARVVNMSLYSIVSSVRNDRRFDIGVSGLLNGYNGHYFWDSPSFISPSLLYLHPDLHDITLAYRLDRIPGAEEKAKSYSPPFAGSMFPWESAFSGQETCPSWAPTGLREVHISGDIAFAVYQHFQVTQDYEDGWIQEVAFPLLSGIADFWLSKAAIDNPGAKIAWYTDRLGSYPDTARQQGIFTSSSTESASPLNILGVIPPDEYADHVNNSVYTNAVASLALSYAVEIAVILGYNESVWGAWADAAPRIAASIPYGIELMSGLPYHPEYDNYTANITVKQADAILLGFPLMVPPTFGNYSASTRANDLQIYAKLTDPNGPAMTWALFALGYCELQEWALAWTNYNRSFANAQPPFGVWTETPSGGTPNFLTGAGGFLQMVLHSTTGLRMNGTGLHFNSPILPENAESVTLRGISYLGSRITISYNSNNNITFMIVPQPTAEEINSLVVMGKNKNNNSSSSSSMHDKEGISSSSSSSSHYARMVDPISLDFGNSEEMEVMRQKLGLGLAPLSTRSQIGRFLRQSGYHLDPRALLVVETNSGQVYPLNENGTPLTLSLPGSFSIIGV